MIHTKGHFWPTWITQDQVISRSCRELNEQSQALPQYLFTSCDRAERKLGSDSRCWRCHADVLLGELPCTSSQSCIKIPISPSATGGRGRRISTTGRPSHSKVYLGCCRGCGCDCTSGCWSKRRLGGSGHVPSQVVKGASA